jgi:hypothetical protein
VAASVCVAAYKPAIPTTVTSGKCTSVPSVMEITASAMEATLPLHLD